MGTVLSAFIAVRLRRVEAQTDGQLTELKARIAVLEELLTWTRGELELAEHRLTDDPPRGS